MVSVDDRGEVDVVMENNMNGEMRELSRLHDDHVALMRDLAEKEGGFPSKEASAVTSPIGAVLLRARRHAIHRGTDPDRPCLG